MNLSEALDAALPEMPQVHLSRQRPPRLDPFLITREEMLDGEPIIGLLQRESARYFRFSPAQWELAQLFDGSRSYEEIAEAFSARAGVAVGASDVRAFADGLEQSEFWYKSPQEKNLALHQKLTAQRGRRSESKVNLAHIGFSAWDPDQYLAWLDRAVGRFIYSQWGVLFALALFLFEAIVFIQNWKVIIPDTQLYFSFTEKSGADLLQFWVLMLMVGFLHETAHGLTCRHFGGQVHSMGLMFLYLLPCFFCDVTEVWVSASKVQRLYTIIAGIWIELSICGVAMIVWTNTPTGAWLHDLAYQVILLTGIAIVIINLNPLIKLDGYYLLTETIEIPDLKERSTAFLSAWVQNKILRLPIEIPVVPRRRAPLFMIYAAISGAYSYILLLVVVRLAFNISTRFIGEFALLPALALAFVIFRSRLKSLRRVTVQWWEERIKAGRKWRASQWAMAVLVVAMLFVPLWRDRESGYFVIGPVRVETLHASVEGRVNAVLVKTGEAVHAGEPLLRMSSITAASLRSSAAAETESARFAAYDAEMRGQSIGAAAAQQTAAERLSRLAADASGTLEVGAPINGVVLTERPGLLLDQDVASGQDLISLAETGPRLARVYIPSSDLDRIPPNAEVALMLPGEFSPIHLRLAPPDGEAVPLPSGIVASQAYKGVQLATFYCSRMELPPAAGNPMFGVSGEAKIFGERRSIAGRLLTAVWDRVRAHVW